MNTFTKTDDLQWVRKITNDTYELIEVRLQSHDPECYIYAFGTVNLKDYSKEGISDYISGYGYDSIDVCKEQYPNAWQQIIAECVFESLPDYELTGFGPYPDEDTAEAEVLKFIEKLEGNLCDTNPFHASHFGG